METNYSKAWSDWLASQEGKRCTNIYSLSFESIAGRKALGAFLTNRLHAAFAAGWNASGVETQKLPPPQIKESSQ